MNKKILFLIVVLLGVAILLAGCGGGRDLSTPSSRLVGHWVNDVQGWHEYFGPVDKTTKTGARVQIGDSGNATYSQYRITKEAVDGELVAFDVIIPGFEDTLKPKHEFLVSKDGMTMTNAKNPVMTHTYVGSETEP